ncbi:MAG: hypothetical protein LBB22_01425 [Treponema sp.]|jgi:hypothetical protein|nr:hypothetical protein [Treponema sp.]
MKNFARFLIRFGVYFILIFLTALVITWLNCWINVVSRISEENGVKFADFFEATRWTLPFTLYLTIIFSVNYGKRLKVPVPLIFIFTVALACGFTFGTAKGLNAFYGMGASPLPIKHGELGRPGLILSQPGTVITLLDQPSNSMGSRVVSINGEHLIYQKSPIGADGEIIRLPPIPFQNGNAMSKTSVFGDLYMSGRHILKRFGEGYMPFFAWILALTLLLVSLSLAVESGNWPLANMFFGFLLFRGILAFEVFLNSENITGYISEFSRHILPDTLIVSVIFTVIACLILVYIILLFLSRLAAKNAKSK